MAHFCENFIIPKLQSSVPPNEVGCVRPDKVPDLTQMSDSRCFPMLGSLVVKAENKQVDGDCLGLAKFWLGQDFAAS